MRRSNAVMIEHRFRVSKVRVYQAWTTPEQMKHWLHPGPEWSNPSIEVDLREGGSYRVGFSHPDEDEISYVVGRFLKIEPGKHLAYTWTWEPPDPNAGQETFVTVNFTDDGDGTLVTLRHDSFPDDETCVRHNEGWGATLACFETYLSSL